MIKPHAIDKPRIQSNKLIQTQSIPSHFHRISQTPQMDSSYTNLHQHLGNFNKPSKDLDFYHNNRPSGSEMIFKRQKTIKIEEINSQNLGNRDYIPKKHFIDK